MATKFKQKQEAGARPHKGATLAAVRHLQSETLAVSTTLPHAVSLIDREADLIASALRDELQSLFG